MNFKFDIKKHWPFVAMAVIVLIGISQGAA